MKHSDPLNSLAAAIHSACLVDLDPVEYRFLTPKERREGMRAEDAPLQSRRPEARDLRRVELWQQTWGSTALGFGGMGGASMTTADVVLVQAERGDACVYFAGRLAYHIKNPAPLFWENVASRQLKDVSESHAYESTPEGPA